MHSMQNDSPHQNKLHSKIFTKDTMNCASISLSTLRYQPVFEIPFSLSLKYNGCEKASILTIQCRIEDSLTSTN